MPDPNLPHPVFFSEQIQVIRRFQNAAQRTRRRGAGIFMTTITDETLSGGTMPATTFVSGGSASGHKISTSFSSSAIPFILVHRSLSANNLIYGFDSRTCTRMPPRSLELGCNAFKSHMARWNIQNKRCPAGRIVHASYPAVDRIRMCRRRRIRAARETSISCKCLMPQTIVIVAINLRVGASWDLTDAGVLIITFS
jgi:hypothetical protein